ncbi:hypothetical protein [Sorangium sp. So ce204]|uniref:hypothetical protein n=1 Tax=Sorangium sp. So ce204 TaxID=3133288 RepID=UPI003F5DE942
MLPAGASAGGGAANGNGSPQFLLVPPRQGTAPDSDLANAERLVALYGCDLRHVGALGGWHAWTGLRSCCDRGTAAECAKETTRRLLTNAEFAMSEAAKRVKRAHDDDEVAKAKAQHKEAGRGRSDGRGEVGCGSESKGRGGRRTKATGSCRRFLDLEPGLG